MKCDKPRPASLSKNIDSISANNLDDDRDQRVNLGQSLEGTCTTKTHLHAETQSRFSSLRKVIECGNFGNSCRSKHYDII